MPARCKKNSTSIIHYLKHCLIEEYVKVELQKQNQIILRVKSLKIRIFKLYFLKIFLKSLRIMN